MIYLASTSPRRKFLLGCLGIEFETIAINIPEDWDSHEQPESYVMRLAQEKALAGQAVTGKNCPVLAADTAVVIDGEVLGKPDDTAAAMQMLGMLSGRRHQVLSAVALAADQLHTALNISHVTFKTLSPAECRAYCEDGEPIGKAGGYAIQGQAAAFIDRLQGSYSGVMGLPLAETSALLENHI